MIGRQRAAVSKASRHESVDGAAAPSLDVAEVATGEGGDEVLHPVAGSANMPAAVRSAMVRVTARYIAAK